MLKNVTALNSVFGFDNEQLADQVLAIIRDNFELGVIEMEIAFLDLKEYFISLVTLEW